MKIDLFVFDFELRWQRVVNEEPCEMGCGWPPALSTNKTKGFIF